MNDIDYGWIIISNEQTQVTVTEVCDTGNNEGL